MHVHVVDIQFTSRSSQTSRVRYVERRGTLTEGADGFYLSFGDHLEEAGVVRYTIKFSSREALIRRRGMFPLTQTLALGVPLAGVCTTPLGELRTQACLQTIVADWRPENGSGRAQIVYSLRVQEQPAGTFNLCFVFNETADRQSGS
ncbi:MAG: DUF1934 domain-containing protein [Sporolactobacillus sp.]